MSKKSRKVKKVKKAVVSQGLFLDLGCGQSPYTRADGVKFSGVDFYADNADYKVDLTRFPWPFKDNSVDEIWCSHFFEHVPGMLRGKFMDEVYRILKVGSKAHITVPAYNSERSIQDYTHQWPPVGPTSFSYFNKGFREGNKLTHGLYDLKCDFDLVTTGVITGEYVQRESNVQANAAKHYMNVMLDYTGVLTKRAPA